MGSRYMGYPSPRGVHVPETHADDDSDPYRRNSARSPRRNRYSRVVHQTPQVDVTWISSPDPTPQTLHAPPTPWVPSPQVPSSPAYRPSSIVPPSPAPTVGEHMAVEDDVVFTQDDIMDPYTYQPERQSGGTGLIKSIWKGLKKLSGFQSSPYIPRTGTYESQTAEVSAPGLSAPSETSRYGNSTPTDEQHGTTPYTSPYVRPTNLGATPAVIPNPSPASAVAAMEVLPPITIVSPSIPSSSVPSSIRSARMASPAMVASRNLSARMPVPVEPPVEEISQTLHEPFPVPARPLVAPALALTAHQPRFFASGAPALDSPSPTKGSLSSTVDRFCRFIADVDDLPWVSDAQIANEYIPERNPRSLMRKRVRQGADPSWYNARPEVVERPEYWSEWDMYAKQSTAAFLDGGDGRAVRWDGAGGPGRWGTMYPRGYAPQPEFVYPSGYPPPGVVGGAVVAST